jgi:hypothetical protein
MENQNLNRLIDEKFNLIESKLRNSFQAVKSHNESIMNKVQDLENLFDKAGAKKLLVEFEKLKANLILDINDVKKQTSDSISNFTEKEIKPIKKQVLNLEKKEIKSALKTELSKELENKIDKKFEKFEKRTEAIRKDVLGYKKYADDAIESKFDSYRENADKLAKLEHKLVKDSIKKQENFVKRENKDMRFDIGIARSSFRKELDGQTEVIDLMNRKLEEYTSQIADIAQNEKKYFLSSVKSNISRFEKTNTEEIETLRRQISYLKGRVNGLLNKNNVPLQPEPKFSRSKSKAFISDLIASFSEKQKAPKPKKVKLEVKIEAPKTKAKNIFSRFIDSLSDDEEVKIKKIEEKKPAKIQTEREKTRTFFSSIINSLAEDVKKEKKSTKKETKHKPLIRHDTSEKNFLNKIVDSLSD